MAALKVAAKVEQMVAWKDVSLVVLMAVATVGWMVELLADRSAACLAAELVANLVVYSADQSVEHLAAQMVALLAVYSAVHSVCLLAVLTDEKLVDELAVWMVA